MENSFRETQWLKASCQICQFLLISVMVLSGELNSFMKFWHNLFSMSLRIQNKMKIKLMFLSHPRVVQLPTHVLPSIIS